MRLFTGKYIQVAGRKNVSKTSMCHLRVHQKRFDLSEACDNRCVEEGMK